MCTETPHSDAEQADSSVGGDRVDYKTTSGNYHWFMDFCFDVQGDRFYPSLMMFSMREPIYSAEILFSVLALVRSKSCYYWHCGPLLLTPISDQTPLKSDILLRCFACPAVVFAVLRLVRPPPWNYVESRNRRVFTQRLTVAL